MQSVSIDEMDSVTGGYSTYRSYGNYYYYYGYNYGSYYYRYSYGYSYGSRHS